MLKDGNKNQAISADPSKLKQLDYKKIIIIVQSGEMVNSLIIKVVQYYLIKVLLEVKKQLRNIVIYIQILLDLTLNLLYNINDKNQR